MKKKVYRIREEKLNSGIVIYRIEKRYRCWFETGWNSVGFELSMDEAKARVLKAIEVEAFNRNPKITYFP
jgi:hypothetical protein